MEKKCPYCGAPLHEEASFCPHCTKIVNERTVPRLPFPYAKHILRVAVPLLVIGALALGIWLYTRPRTYDNGSPEVIYTDKDGSYQFCIAWANAPFSPFNPRETSAEVGFKGRYPVLVYINHVESDSHATKAFQEKIAYWTAEIVRSDAPLRITCTRPEYDSGYVPDASAVTLIDWCVSEVGDWTADLVVTAHMENGDTVRLHQQQLFHALPTYHYTSEDVPMDTVEDLETLLEQIDRTVEEDATVYVHLPPVTYTDTFTIATDKLRYLIGSEDGAGNRTTFTSPVQMVSPLYSIIFVEGIDFIGSGDGIGVSFSNKVHLTGCRVAGWRTGVLAYGQYQAWVNLDECVVEDNDIGLHFNLQYGAVTDSWYEDNLFRNNGTAVLLESTGTDYSLKFSGTQFVHNGADIDNRCSQALELEGAAFE